MTRNNREAELQYLISKCKSRLLQLKPHLDLSELTNVMYNKILVEKAIYIQELKDMKAGFFRRLLQTVNKANPSSRHLICDYFHRT